MDKHFYSLTELPDSYYEVEKMKKKIDLSLPTHLGVFTVNYTKLRMLKFYYDFLDYYLLCEDFEVLEMDTDSNYLGITAENVEDLIIPDSMKNLNETSITGLSPHSHPKANIPLDSLKSNLKATK